MSKDKHIKQITKESMKNAVEYNYHEMVTDKKKDAFVAELSEAFDSRFGDNNPDKREVIRPKRRAKKTYRTAIAVVCCTAIFTVAVTGGVVSTFEPTRQNVNQAPQATQQEENTGTDGVTEQKQTTKVTESTVEYENDTSNVEKATIALTGGSKGTNYANPTKIQLQGNNIKSGTCEWTISKYKTDETLYTGKGTTIDKQLTGMIKNKANGKYLVKYEYKDKDDNKIILYEGFMIKIKSTK